MVARETETGELRVDLMEQARDLPTPLPACTSFCETSEVLARYQHSCPVWRSCVRKPPSRPDPLPREHDALQCWSDRRQTSQQDVSEGFGVAHAIEASNLDQLVPEDGF